MSNPRPFVAAAIACEQVLVSEDKVPSLIRLVDILSLDPIPGLPKGAIAAVRLTLFVALRSLEITGDHNVHLVLHTPSGKPRNLPPAVAHFRSPDAKEESVGANLILKLDLPVEEFGRYWFDIQWEGETLTRIPVKLVLKGEPVSQPSPLPAKT